MDKYFYELQESNNIKKKEFIRLENQLENLNKIYKQKAEDYADEL